MSFYEMFHTNNVTSPTPWQNAATSAYNSRDDMYDVI